MQSLNFKFKFDLLVKRKVLVKAENYAFFAFTYDDAFQTYEYAKLSFPTAVEITSLSQIEATFFDWRYHFQMEASSTTNDEKFLMHVVLNESNVLDCFFDKKLIRTCSVTINFHQCIDISNLESKTMNVQSNPLSRCLKNKLSAINTKRQQKTGLS